MTELYKNISRRSFLKAALAVGSTLALAGCGETETITNTVTNTVTVTEKITNTVTNTVVETEVKLGTMPSSKRIVFHQEYCAGCGTCVLACSGAHFGEYNKKLGALRMDADFCNNDFVMYLCAQCDAASCVSACTVDAIKFDEKTGARYVDQDACIGCGNCVEACPFSDKVFPPIHFETLSDGSEVLVKCDLCRGREAGPACAEICFFKALSIEG